MNRMETRDAEIIEALVGPCDQTDHDPSPEEIRRACLAIQRSWTEDERQRRAGCYRQWEELGFSEAFLTSA